MLKWAIAKEDRRDSRNNQNNSSCNKSNPSYNSNSSSTKSLLRKRRKLSHSNVQLKDGAEIELISGTKSRNQNTGGSYLKQHNHPRWNNSSSLRDDSKALKTKHCRFPDNNNTCKNDHVAKTTASHNTHNGRHNGVINSSDSFGSTANISSTNADSKSLLYMSLDHLPLAIVKQYERMLQEQETEDNNNNNNDEYDDYDNGDDEPEKLESRAIPSTATTTTATTIKQGAKTKKSLSFTASTIPYRFKSKLSQSQKKVILPLHGSIPVGTTKTLNHLSKAVKQTQPVKNRELLSEPTEEEHYDQESRDTQPTSTKVSSTTTVTTVSSSSPSPLSASSAGGGTEIIRHARSRSLRTCSFKTKVNDDNNESKIISSSPNSHNNRKVTTTMGLYNEHNTISSEKFYNLPLSPSHKSSTLPRARNQTGNKSIQKTISSQTTQTYKSILKNPLELNNNNFTTANQNSIIENLSDIHSPIRRPFQSLLNVSTQCNPPTPVTKKTNTHFHQQVSQKQQMQDDDYESDEEEDEKEVIEQVKETCKLVHQSTNDPDHDTTDPQFLEKSLTFSFPAVTRCAKKLTLKRSELRKLERIRSHTDRLNRFLRKYYHECLPNLPEEEDSQCSPEEKSVSILRKHWLEDSTHSRRSSNTKLDHGSLTNLFNNTTTSSSSISSSCSSSSICSSSSSSDNDWRNYGHGDNSHGRSNHGSSSSGRKSRQKRHARSMLNNNETTLLPIIQEDSAEVSSASVKSLESRISEHAIRRSQKQQGQSIGPAPSTLIVMDSVKEDAFSLNDDGIDVKRDNMGDVEDHSCNTYSRNAFVTEGAGTDFLKLKGSFMSDSEKPFDLPPTLPFMQESLRNPQPSFTPPHPSPSSSTSLFHENTDAQSLTSTSSSHSHGYGSGSGTTIRTMDHIPDRSDDAIVPAQQPLQQQLIQLDINGGINYQNHDGYYEDEEGILPDDGNSSRATISSSMTTNANYPSETENETWNSHEYPSGSPCESSNEDEREEDTIQSHVETPSFALSQPKIQQLAAQVINNNHAKRSPNPGDTAHFDRQTIPKTPSPEPANRLRTHRQEDSDEDESLADPGRGPMFITPIRRIMKTPCKKSTPRKLVRKPPVKSIFSGKGEVLIRTYSNGDYVTLHVVHAKNLQPSFRSSWKLAIKISLLPEAEETFTKSESVEVNKNRTWAKIDQKFSFEISKNQYSDQKIFLSFWKRHDRKTSFLGWTTLNLSSLCSSTNTSISNKTSQCWYKLRKRKMSATTTSAATYMPAAYSASQKMNGTKGRTSSKSSPLPLEIETLEEVQTPESHDDDNNHFHHHHHPDEIKSQFPNSATMDSGVEDCCEPPVVQPSIELDETQGKRVAVKMVKHENQGFGFSVVWVSPPRIERLEKDKTADLAGLRIGDLIIGVNGEDVTTVPNTTIYHSMKTTGNELELEVWRKNPPAPTPATVVKTNAQIGSMVMMLMTGTGTGHNLPKMTSPTPPAGNHHANVANNNIAASSSPRHGKQPSSLSSSSSPAPHPSTSPVVLTANANTAPASSSNNNNTHQHVRQSQPESQPQVPAVSTAKILPSKNIPITTANVNVNSNNPPIRVQLPPVSILKPPPPAPPTSGPPISPLISSHNHLQRSAIMTKKLPSHPQPTLNSSSWRIRFNVELLDNEEDSLKQFFICELKFFRKVVAALDRYLIPAQANKLLTPQEIHSIFAHIITIITMTKRILQCVANGAPKAGWRLGEILFSTHSDHLSEISSAYSSYASNLGNSSLILGEKMTLQSFARFVLETPVPKGHLDITSLLFAPLEHLRNLCEICDEILHHFDHWTDFSAQLKECYANIVVRTDYMEPISHVSMKKHPLLSVRDLEKRIVSTSCQPFKVNEKGRKWLFGSRLFRREADGSWAPVWAFLFTDIIVLTSHMTRDRVFFVKEAPIKLEDVVTLHFNLPRKNENEFRLVFGPEPTPPTYGRFDRILPIYRRPKSNQIILRTTNLQLKSMWKLLLQRQIITLNTRLSKSSSSNFSISEFCEKFPESNAASSRHEEKIDEEPEEDDENGAGDDTMCNNKKSSANPPSIPVVGMQDGQSTDSVPKKSISSGLHCKVPVQSNLFSSGFNSLNGSPHSSKKNNVEEKVGSENHVSQTREETRRLISDLAVTPSTGFADDSKKRKSDDSIIKHPQRCTVQVPDNQQLVVSGEDVSKSKDGFDHSRVKASDTAHTPSKVLSQSPLANAIHREAHTFTPLSPNNSDLHHRVVETENINFTQLKARDDALKASDTKSTATNCLSQMYSSPLKGNVHALELVSKTGCSKDAMMTDTNSRGGISLATSVITATSKRENDGKFCNSKYNQKPVEMLASPSEGSPSRSYLYSRKTTMKVESLINNNNDSISDLNHHGSDKKAETKCECEGPREFFERILKDSARAASAADRISLSQKAEILVQREVLKPDVNGPEISHDNDINKKDICNPKPCTSLEKTTSSLLDQSKQKSSSIIMNDSAAVLTSSFNKVSLTSTADDIKFAGNVTSEQASKNTALQKDNELILTQMDVQSDNNITPAGKITLGKSPIKPEEKGKVDESNSKDTKTSKNASDVSSSSLSTGGKVMRGDLQGPKIMTNAILKSRQQEQLAGVKASVEGDKVVPTVRDQKTMTECNGLSSKPICLPTTKIGVVENCRDSDRSVTASSSGAEAIAKRNIVAPSKMELERHPADLTGSNSCSKGKVYTNSPIVSGIGSDKSRRRLLYDYKVRRDYPELFGITPRDRRSFIKKLGEQELVSDKDLVAPYYYHTRLSPLPGLKNLRNDAAVQSSLLAKDDSSMNSDKIIKDSSVATTSQTQSEESRVSTSAATNTTISMTTAFNKNGLHRMRLLGSLEDDDDDASTSTGSNSQSTKKTVHSATPYKMAKDNDEVEEEVEDDDSDMSATGRSRVRDLIDRPDEVHLHRRRRSPEESSSNDSGISEEILIVTEGAKTANFAMGAEGSEDLTLATSSIDQIKAGRFPSTLREHEVISSTNLNRCAVSTSSCTAATIHALTNSPSVHVSKKYMTDNSSRNTTSCNRSNLTKVDSIDATLVETNTQSSHGIQANPVLSSVANTADAHNALNNADDSLSNSSTQQNAVTSTELSTKSKMNHVCFVEGETTNGTEAMVVLTKEDKATGMEDDDLMDFSWLCRLPEKTYRNLLADRREAFFRSNHPHLLSDTPSQCHPHPPSYNRINSNSSTLTTITSSSHASSYSSSGLPPVNVPKEPLVVKIYEGGTVQNTIQPEQLQSASKIPNSCERVMLTRLEKQTTAHVERVESSDDSTSSSSDVASASPAAENGTTDPSWSSSSSSLAGYSSSIKEEPSPSTSATAHQNHLQKMNMSILSTKCNTETGPSSSSLTNGFYHPKSILVSSFLDNRCRPEIVVTGESPDRTKNVYLLQSDEDDDDEQAISNSSIVSNGRENQSGSSGRNEFLRVESNDSTAENYGDDDDYNFDDDEDELSHCSVATMNRYGTYESLEKIETDDTIGTLPDFPRNMPRSKARFTFDDDDDDDDDLFEEDFESDFNFRFPSQIQDNTYSVSRLGPLPPLLEEDYEDDMYEETRAGSESPSNSTGEPSQGSTQRHNQVHQPGVRGDNSFLLARIATMYARSSISPLKIFRELWLKKRYRQWANTNAANGANYKE